MKIGMDATLFKSSERRGIAVTVYEVIKIWIRIYPQHEYYLFASSPISLDIIFPDNWHIIDEGNPKNSTTFWLYTVMPDLLKKYSIDVFWGTGTMLPPNVPKVIYYVSLDDMATLLFPENVPKRQLLKTILFYRRACKRAHKVITVSKSAKADICRLFHIPNEKIVVSYHGGFEGKNEIEFDEKNVRPELRIKDYFLFISAFEPRKNILTIVKAFEKYKKAYGGKKKLVLAGKHEYKAQVVLEYIKQSSQKEYIIIPGYINTDEKRYLYKNASCFLFPSLYEGFGIPIIESFEYGVPVIASEISSMPEIGGEVAYYIKNPTDADELALQMHTVEDMNRLELMKLRERMKERLKMFSWEDKAKGLMEMFEFDRHML